MRAALAQPARVDRIVLLGCPAFVPGWEQPAFFTLLRTPIIGQIIVRMPAGQRDVLRFLHAMGSEKAVATNRIPDSVLDHTVAWMGHTGTMRNDAAMIRACGTRARGFDPDLDLRPHELATIETPTLVIGGSEDPVGGPAVVSGLAQMLARGTVATIPDAGHLPWIDDSQAVADELRAFLASA